MMKTQSFITVDTNDCVDGLCAPSFSTNSTRSGLPGPGRNLDRLFQAIGGRLERTTGKAIKRYAQFSNSLDRTQTIALYVPHAHDTLLRDVGTSGAESSLSTNATQSNLPGPGRNLDRLYNHLGRNLEAFLSSLAQRSGWGPSAAERRVIEVLCHQPRKAVVGSYDLLLFGSHYESLSEQDWPKYECLSRKAAKRVRKACKKLLHYTHSSSEENQILALRHILDLASIWPDLHGVFRRESALCILSTLPKLLSSRIHGLSDHEELLTSSRRALFCIEENGLNNLAKKMVTADFTSIDQKEGWNWFHHYLLLSLTLLGNPDTSFLALRYLGHPFLLRSAKSHIDREKVAEFMGTMLIYALTQDSLDGKFELDVFARVLDETCFESFVSWELMPKKLPTACVVHYLGVDIPSLRNHSIKSDDAEWLGDLWRGFVNHLQGSDNMSNHIIIQFARQLDHGALTSDSFELASVFRELSILEVELENARSFG